MKILPSSFPRDLIRAYQYLYYVEAISLMSDRDYDHMQKAYENDTQTEIPVGSDSASDYNKAEIALAIYLRSACT